MVSALDHNYHLRRQFRVSADGTPLLHKNYSARTKREFVRGVKEVKTYPYIEPLLALATEFACNPALVPAAYRTAAAFDPKSIAPTIRPIASTSSAQLLQQHHYYTEVSLKSSLMFFKLVQITKLLCLSS